MKQFVIKAYDGKDKLDKDMEVQPHHILIMNVPVTEQKLSNSLLTQADDSFSNRQVFADMESDGMMIDNRGVI